MFGDQRAVVETGLVVGEDFFDDSTELAARTAGGGIGGVFEDGDHVANVGGSGVGGDEPLDELAADEGGDVGVGGQPIEGGGEVGVASGLAGGGGAGSGGQGKGRVAGKGEGLGRDIVLAVEEAHGTKIHAAAIVECGGRNDVGVGRFEVGVGET